MENMKMNFKPKIWGGSLWKSLHTISLSYPLTPTSADKKTYKNFFENIGDILPCEKCQGNYSRHLKEINIDDFLNSPFDLFSWVVKMQNIVAKETGADYQVDEELLKGYYFSKNLDLLHVPQIANIVLFIVLIIGIFLIQQYLDLNILFSLLPIIILLLVGAYLFEKYIYHYLFIPKRFIIGGLIVVTMCILYYIRKIIKN